METATNDAWTNELKAIKAKIVDATNKASDRSKHELYESALVDGLKLKFAIQAGDYARATETINAGDRIIKQIPFKDCMDGLGVDEFKADGVGRAIKASTEVINTKQLYTDKPAWFIERLEALLDNDGKLHFDRLNSDDQKVVKAYTYKVESQSVRTYKSKN